MRGHPSIASASQIGDWAPVVMGHAGSDAEEITLAEKGFRSRIVSASETVHAGNLSVLLGKSITSCGSLA